MERLTDTQHFRRRLTIERKGPNNLHSQFCDTADSFVYVLVLQSRQPVGISGEETEASEDDI